MRTQPSNSVSEDLSFNPIAERRAQNQQTIAKSFVSNIEDDVDIAGNKAFMRNANTITDDFRKSFGTGNVVDMIEKSNSDDLEKGGGVGSRGGKVIGYTKSGKPIYEDAKNLEHKKFTDQDHLDSAYLHGKISDEIVAKSDKKNKESGGSGYNGPGAIKSKSEKEKQKYHMDQFETHYKKFEGKAGRKEAQKDWEDGHSDPYKFVQKVKKSFDDDLSGSNGKTLLTHKSLDYSMMDDVEAVRRRKAVDQLADNLQKSNVNDLEKGEIMDKLVYGYGNNNDTFKFNKTGKEIKAMLPTCIISLAEQKGQIESQMVACVETAGIEPTEPYNNSTYKVIKMLRYPYDLISSKYDDVSRSYATPTDSQKACGQYNDLCYSLRSVLEDILACKIILANVEDDKKYSLNISQLVALTLGDDLLNG